MYLGYYCLIQAYLQYQFETLITMENSVVASHYCLEVFTVGNVELPGNQTP